MIIEYKITEQACGATKFAFFYEGVEVASANDIKWESNGGSDALDVLCNLAAAGAFEIQKI
jgi:hypothetical protein|tara:strand:+ start:345 stop:527 length:183 start_codon:yes stop_codon:yes gene_type:complete